MLSRVTDTMNYVSNHIDDQMIDYICDTMKRARTIFLFGYGASLVIVTDLFQNYRA